LAKELSMKKAISDIAEVEDVHHYPVTVEIFLKSDFKHFFRVGNP